MCADASHDLAEHRRVASLAFIPCAAHVGGDDVGQRRVRISRKIQHASAIADRQRGKHWLALRFRRRVQAQDGRQVEEVDGVENDIDLAHQFETIVLIQVGLHSFHRSRWIDAQDMLFQRRHFGPANIVKIVKLAIQVMRVDRIAVDQYKILKPHARGADRGRRA